MRNFVGPIIFLPKSAFRALKEVKTVQKETIIQSITVGQNLQETYTVGDDIGGRVIIEINSVGRKEEDGDEHEGYAAFDEDEFPILYIENMPVIVEYKTIVVDDSEEPYGYEVSDETPF